MAHRDAVIEMTSRMRRELGDRYGDFVKDTNAKGQFEFKNVPFGEYKLAAVAKAGGQDLVWLESIQVTNSIPQFIELKKLVP